MKIHPVFHASLLHPRDPNAFPVTEPPPPIEILHDGDEIHEIEAIVDSRYNRRRRRIEYRCRWVGWSQEHDTWEPLTHLHDCMTSVREFVMANPSKPHDLVIARDELTNEGDPVTV